MQHRQRFAVFGLALAGVLLATVAVAQDDRERALAVLDEAPIVDGHNDLPWVIREKFGGDVENHDISVYASYDTDIPRLREGRVGTQFWSVYVPSSMSDLEAMTVQLEQIDIAHRIINRYPDDLMLATSITCTSGAIRVATASVILILRLASTFALRPVT